MLSYDDNLGNMLSYFAKPRTKPSNVVAVHDGSNHGFFQVQHVSSSSQEVDGCCNGDDGSGEADGRFGRTEFVFASHCAPTQGPLEPGRLLLTGPADLNSPGVWDSSSQRWLRVLTLAGCAVDVWLWEDQPVEPKDVGELLLWPAALVLTRCLDSQPICGCLNRSKLTSPTERRGDGSKLSVDRDLRCGDFCLVSTRCSNDRICRSWLAELVRGSLVVELGAGAGLPSLAASLGGAKRVVATEGAPDAVAFLQANMTTNQRLAGSHHSDTDYSIAGNNINFHASTATATTVSLPIVQRAWWGDPADVVSVYEALSEPGVNGTAARQTKVYEDIVEKKNEDANDFYLKGASATPTGVPDASNTQSNVRTSIWPDLIIGSDITFSSNLHDQLLSTLAGDPLKDGDSIEEETSGADSSAYDGRCGLLGPHTVCLLAHDNDSTPLSRTSLRDFVAASRRYCSAAVPSSATTTPTNLCSTSLWCVELPPPWRSVLDSSGVNSVPAGKRVRKPTLPSHSPSTPLQKGPSFELHQTWPPEWEAPSVTLLMLRRWSPVVELVRAWWSSAVPVRDASGYNKKDASHPRIGSEKTRAQKRVENYRTSMLVFNQEGHKQGVRQ